tara:strand:+ start:498 stop:620 length:123 start_codon:yes stop_codon:yes gene_type:complete
MLAFQVGDAFFQGSVTNNPNCTFTGREIAREEEAVYFIAF